MNIDVSILIVNRNGIRLNILRDCINTIARFAPACKYEILVWDNGSDDGSADWLESKQIKVIRHDGNAGFSFANNRLAEIASGKYILLLNNDTVITGTNWLDAPLAELKSNPAIGAIGAQGGIIERLRLSFRGVYQPNYRGSVDYIEGWYLLTAKTTWDRLGGLDEAYHYYCEDHDFSRRLRQYGLDSVKTVVPIRHLGSMTSRKNKGISAVSESAKSEKTMREKFLLKPPVFWQAHKRALIIRRGALGDVLNTTPILRQIKAINPNIEITYLTANACIPIVERNKYIDRIVSFESVRDLSGEFDIVVNLDDYQYRNIETDVTCCLSPNSVIRGGHPLMVPDTDARKTRGATRTYPSIYAEIAGVNLDSEKPEYYSNLPAGSIDYDIVVSLDSGWPTRNYSEPVKLLEAMAERYRIAVIGRKMTTPTHKNVDNYTGKTSLDEMYQLIGRGAVFVGVDSLPLHFASIHNKPTVALYNVTHPANVVAVKPDKYVELSPKHLSCSPCYLENCSHNNYLRLSCWSYITPERIMEAINEIK